MTRTMTGSKRDWAKMLSLGFIEDRNGKRRKVAWPYFAILGVALPVLSLIALYRIFFTDTGVSIGLWALAGGLYSVTLLGVTVGYHRLFTHEGFAAAWGVRLVLLIAAGMSWEGDVKTWVMRHRRHHALADVVGADPHSPWEYPGWRGLLWAQWFWLFFDYKMPENYRPRDLEEDKLVQWQSGRFGFPVLAVASLAIPAALYGWNGLLVAGILRLTAMLTITGFINSWCHMWGTKSQDSLGQQYVCDDSVNSTPVALLSFGEGNHGDHHGDPKSARHGRKPVLTTEAVAAGIKPEKRFKPDLSWRVIQFLQWLGLVWDVYVTPSHIVLEDKSIAPKKALRAIHELDSTESRAGQRMHAADLRREQALKESAAA